jgi:hypothetical protein
MQLERDISELAGVIRKQREIAQDERGALPGVIAESVLKRTLRPSGQKPLRIASWKPLIYMRFLPALADD